MAMRSYRLRRTYRKQHIACCRFKSGSGKERAWHLDLAISADFPVKHILVHMVVSRDGSCSDKERCKLPRGTQVRLNDIIRGTQISAGALPEPNINHSLTFFCEYYFLLTLPSLLLDCIHAHVFKKPNFRMTGVQTRLLA